MRPANWNYHAVVCWSSLWRGTGKGYLHTDTAPATLVRGSGGYPLRDSDPLIHDALRCAVCFQGQRERQAGAWFLSTTANLQRPTDPELPEVWREVYYAYRDELLACLILRGPHRRGAAIDIADPLLKHKLLRGLHRPLARYLGIGQVEASGRLTELCRNAVGSLIDIGFATLNGQGCLVLASPSSIEARLVGVRIDRPEFDALPGLEGLTT